ncbi:MAG: hypothetical protein DRN25_00295 [Thermoplasmata archaeon]|nr:MAG: hypothetical protein DRN25_00295 [Thermoplasmata archaeon]
MRILGVDIASGSINSKTEPKYSIVLLDGNRFVYRDEVTRSKLMSIVKELKPDRIACDNIFELFNKKNMFEFFSFLPEETKLIQVNGNLNVQEPLHIVARRNGIPLSAKASSMEEAEACALLGSKNVGYEVSLFEGGYYIVVSRGRSVGKGGQSQDRYRRRIHAMVAFTVREIEDKLKEKGIKYKLRVVKADHGLSRGSFFVECKRSELYGIKKRKGPDVQVKIIPKHRRKLKFIPLCREKEMVIVGIDPGTTTGVAVLDIKGRLLEITSGKNFSLDKVISLLMKYKKVLIVASDVSPAPKFVEKVSSSLNALLCTPFQSLSIDEKNSLVSRYFSKDSYSNAHERDALAAAIKAYRKYKMKIPELERKFKINEKKIVNNVNKYKPEKNQKNKEKKERNNKQKELIRSLKEEIELLKKEREELKRTILEKDRIIKELERKIEELKDEVYLKIRKEREIEIKNKKIRQLSEKLIKEKLLREKIQRKLNELRRQRLIEFSDSFFIVKILSKLSKEEIQKLKKEFKEGDVVYIVDSHGGGKSVAEELLRLRPKAIIAELEKMSHLAREVLNQAIVISPHAVEIRMIGGFGIVEKDILENLIENEKKKRLEKVISEYRLKRIRKFSSLDR